MKFTTNVISFRGLRMWKLSKPPKLVLNHIDRLVEIAFEISLIYHMLNLRVNLIKKSCTEMAKVKRRWTGGYPSCRTATLNLFIFDFI